MQAWAYYSTADEFLADETFRDWVRSGAFMQPDHPFTHWLNEHPALLIPARQGAEFLAATALHEQPVADTDVQQLIANTWHTIRERETDPIGADPKLISLWHRTFTHWRVAAAITVVGGLVSWLLLINSERAGSADNTIGFLQKESENKSVQRGPTERGPAWIKEANRTAADQLISLSDGSVVYLRPNSSLRHPVSFAADRREVELVGEAFFEVAKNPNQPFFVRTQTLTTRVVGTSFLVRALDQQASVQVRTGRVVVYANQTLTAPSPRIVTLQANQQVTVRPADETLQPETVQQPSALARKLNQQSFSFNDAPITTVLDQVAQTYGIRIDYDAVRFANCRVTTTLGDEPLTEKLSVLAEVIGPDARYEVDGNRIRFSGRGCP
ncbi:FecR family protein [Spirosoma montaniterrae]|uniref:FecR protein domain-containing protein n=1 Tax=Spirosoma montaniterrae TaxID=1178516 RepID=A0A1P9X046_9BACT|nr:FecR family protein [Spirosoma montaniterrae]AQG80978.1 hypothetical protein AWR27_17595 [Spirosoma montaniterrae]